MKKRIICLVLMLVAVVSSCAFAEQSTAVPSITVSAIVVPDEVVINTEVPLVIEVKEIVPESVEKVVLDEITEAVQVQNVPVATCFGEEAIAAIAEVMPEGTELNADNLQIDEFIALETEGYVAEYGEVAVTFAFPTEYEADAVLIAMVGIMPTEEETVAAEADETITAASLIKWIPVKTEVEEGNVKITFSEEVLTMMNERGAVMALLREGEAIVEETVAE